MAALNRLFGLTTGILDLPQHQKDLIVEYMHALDMLSEGRLRLGKELRIMLWIQGWLAGAGETHIIPTTCAVDLRRL